MLYDIFDFILDIIIKILKFIGDYIPFVIGIFTIAAVLMPDQPEPVLPGTVADATAYISEFAEQQKSVLMDIPNQSSGSSETGVPSDIEGILVDQQKEWMDEAMKQDAMNAYQDYLMEQQQQYDNSIPAFGYPD